MEVLPLPPVIDSASVGPLRQDILARRGAELTLDLAPVQRIGGLGLQVVLAACRQWTADGRLLALTGASPAFTHMLRLTGASSLVQTS